MEHFLKVLSYHGQIDAQISYNSCQIRLKDPQEHKEKLQAPCYSNLPERKWSPGMRWDNFSSHAITLFGNDAFIQLSKLAKSGSWHCHLQWQCTRSCVTYLMQEMYQWKEDELLLTYMPHVNFQINWLWNNGPLNMDYLFFDTHCRVELFTHKPSETKIIQIGTAWLLMHSYVTGGFCLRGLWMNSSTLITMAIGSGPVSR